MLTSMNQYLMVLLSKNMVYVGQASDLAKRITQHKVGKDWWESVVILTAKDNSLTHSDIDYLEATLMSGGELTAEVTADYLRREHLPDRAFSSEKARYHRPAGTMPEEGVVIQRRYNKSQAA